MTTTTAANICQHGIDFNAVTTEGECPHCEWCDTCRRVTLWDGESCQKCGRVWGCQDHDNAFTLMRPQVDALVAALAHPPAHQYPRTGRMRTLVSQCAEAVAALAPIPHGITPRLRQAMLEATKRALLYPEPADTSENPNPFVVAQIDTNDWAVLRQHTATAGGLTIVARIGSDGFATLV